MSFSPDMLEILGQALRLNAHLRCLGFNTIEGEAQSQLVEQVLPNTGVERVEKKSGGAVLGIVPSIRHVLAENRRRRVFGTLSAQRNRPFQRLLLAALHEASSLALSYDLTLTILGHLHKATSNPFKTSNHRSLPSDEAVFLWHVPEESIANRVRARKRRKFE